MSNRISIELENNVIISKVEHLSEDHEPDALPSGHMDITNHAQDPECGWSYDAVANTFTEPPPEET